MQVAQTAGDGVDPLVLSRVWHREDIGVVAGAADNRFFVPSLQAIVYLQDVGPRTHCFSIVPESADTKRALPTRHHDAARPLVIDDAATAGPGQWVEWADYLGRPSPRRPGSVDVHAPAGSVIIFNNCSFHACTVRRTEQIRRTLHVRFRTHEPAASAHGLSPPFRTVEEFTAALPRNSRPRAAAAAAVHVDSGLPEVLAAVHPWPPRRGLAGRRLSSVMSHMARHIGGAAPASPMPWATRVAASGNGGGCPSADNVPEKGLSVEQLDPSDRDGYMAMVLWSKVLAFWTRFRARQSTSPCATRATL